MKMLIPIIIGLIIGVFGGALGLNGVALMIGLVVGTGIWFDNLGQALYVTLIIGLVIALAELWVISLVILIVAIFAYAKWSSNQQVNPP